MLYFITALVMKRMTGCYLLGHVCRYHSMRLFDSCTTNISKVMYIVIQFVVAQPKPWLMEYTNKIIMSLTSKI